MPTTRYVPDTFEQECICLLYTWLTENGFQNPDLPPIYLSFEIPPKLENIWRKISEDEEGRDEWFTTDGVIGLYHSKGCSGSGTPEIVLYAQGITAVAKSLNVPTEMVRAVVLVHELGHWISHAVPDSQGQVWDTEHFCAYSKAQNPNPLLEMWAQLFPYWVAKEIQGLFKLTFEVINSKQSKPYETFKTFTRHKKEDMFKVLVDFHRPEFKKDDSININGDKTKYTEFYREMGLPILREKVTENMTPEGQKTIKNSNIF